MKMNEYVYSQVPLFIIVRFYIRLLQTELVNAETLLLGEIYKYIFTYIYIRHVHT